MQHTRRTIEGIAVSALVNLHMDSLTAIYHEASDRMIDAGLYQQQFDIMEPLMEYHIDGIDEATDDENQTNLKTLAAHAYIQMQNAINRHDIDQAPNPDAR